MRKLLLATAIALLPVAAGATTSPLTGDWSLSGLSDVTASPSHLTDGTIDNVPLSGTQSPASLFTLDPGDYCTGSHCSSNTVTETITVSLTSLSFEGVSLAPITLTGTYTAKYSGSELSCAVGDGVSPSSGETDCFIWTGASDTYNGSTTVDETIGSTGKTLVLTFDNATDWDITPKLSAQIENGGNSDAPPVPEPASLALLGTGLVGLVLMRRRTNGRSAVS